MLLVGNNYSAKEEIIIAQRSLDPPPKTRTFHRWRVPSCVVGRVLFEALGRDPCPLKTPALHGCRERVGCDRSRARRINMSRVVPPCMREGLAEQAKAAESKMLF